MSETIVVFRKDRIGGLLRPLPRAPSRLLKVTSCTAYPTLRPALRRRLPRLHRPAATPLLPTNTETFTRNWSGGDTS